MFKLFSRIWVTAFFILVLSSSAFPQASTEHLVITTYYPSPEGSYRNLTANRMKIGSTYSAPATAFENNGLIVEGRVGIGTPTPNHPLHMGSGAFCNAGGNWTDASDIAYKKNITDLKYGLEEALKLQPREFDMKQGNSHQIGFIAQEMEKIIPEVVSGKEGEKGISYGNITALLVNAIKEQQREIENLKIQITELKSKRRKK